MAKKPWNRKQIESIYGQRYKTLYHRWPNRFVCFYCGVPAISYDHVPPISRASDYESLCLKNEIYIKVICCDECNSFAHDTLQNDIHERHDYIKAKMKSKYAKDLTVPHWEEEEIKPLGRGLKSKVLSSLARYERASSRIEYAEGIQYFYDMYEISQR